ncbi:MAG: hypothetical protein OSB00_01555 [Sphingomonas bacterium]|nr:hypothetical protein [Sphingomonas bacterium]
MADIPPAILIVEDEIFVAWDEAQAMEGAGYRVLGPAHDLASGIGLAQAESPCAAVLDINLGDETVWPLAEMLDEAGIPFVFVTADLGHPELQTRYADVTRISKPTSQAQLLGAVASLLAGPEDVSFPIDHGDDRAGRNVSVLR